MCLKATIFAITLALFFQTSTAENHPKISDAVGCRLGSTFVLLRLKQHEVALENLTPTWIAKRNVEPCGYPDGSQFFLQDADGKHYRLKSATIEGLDRLGLKVGEEGESVHFECGDVTTEGPNLSGGKMVALLTDHQGGEFTQEIPCKFLRVVQEIPTE
jgi:hypothetical protein